MFNNLFEIVKWRIINDSLIEVVPEDRMKAWNYIIINNIKKIPITKRSGLRSASIKNFDYKQPICYDRRSRTLFLPNEMLLRLISFSNNNINIQFLPFLNLNRITIFLSFTLSLFIISLNVI